MPKPCPKRSSAPITLTPSFKNGKAPTYTITDESGQPLTAGDIKAGAVFAVVLDPQKRTATLTRPSQPRTRKSPATP